MKQKGMVFPSPFVGSGRNHSRSLLESQKEPRFDTSLRHLILSIIITIKCVKFVLCNFRHTNICSSAVAEHWCKHERLLSPGAVVADCRGSRIFRYFCVFLDLALQPDGVFWPAATREHYGIVSFPEQGVVNYSEKRLFLPFLKSPIVFCTKQRILNQDFSISGVLLYTIIIHGGFFHQHVILTR